MRSKANKSKRDRQIKSPTIGKAEFRDIDMLSDGFSVLTAEKSINCKTGFLNEKQDEDRNSSYLSMEEEKFSNKKKRNFISRNSSSLNSSSKAQESSNQPERTKMRSISSASSIKSIQTTQK